MQVVNFGDVQDFLIVGIRKMLEGTKDALLADLNALYWLSECSAFHSSTLDHIPAQGS